MKTNFIGLKKLIEEMNECDYMFDHDLNLSILNPDLKKQIKALLNLDNKIDISRFLTMVVCFFENGIIDDDLTEWSEDEYIEYLKTCEIDELADNQYVKEFLLNFQCRFF